LTRGISGKSEEKIFGLREVGCRCRNPGAQKRGTWGAHFSGCDAFSRRLGHPPSDERWAMGGSLWGERGGGLRGCERYRDPSRSKDALRMTARTDNDKEQTTAKNRQRRRTDNDEEQTTTKNRQQQEQATTENKQRQEQEQTKTKCGGPSTAPSTPLRQAQGRSGSGRDDGGCSTSPLVGMTKWAGACGREQATAENRQW
jgi:hypothetical protein